MEIITKYDINALDKFIEEVMKQYNLKSDPKDVKEMLIEELKEKAKSMKKGQSVVPIAVDKDTLRNAIIKCSSHVKAWKLEKKKKTETKKNFMPIENNLDEEIEEKPKKKVIRKKKAAEESEEEFEELSLF